MTTTAARIERAFDTPCNCCNDCVPISTDGRSVFMDGFGEIPLQFNATEQADEIAKLKGEAGVFKALLALSRRSLVAIDGDDDTEKMMLDSLVDKIDAALQGAS